MKMSLFMMCATGVLVALSSVKGEEMIHASSEGTCLETNAECSSSDDSNAAPSAYLNSLPIAEEEHPQFRCNIFMAPSSIKGAGFGIYTMNDIAKGEKILPYSDSPSIALCDQYSNGLEETDWNPVDYLWSGKGMAEYECKSASESVMGFGALSNFHTFLANVHPYNEPYDDAAANRFKDPSAGSFSYLAGHYFESTRDIKAGEEIYADYGETWLDHREGTFADYIPRWDDYGKAEKIMKTIQQQIASNKVELSDGIMKTFKSVTSAMDERVGSLIPETAEQFQKIVKNTYLTRTDTIKELLARETIEEHSIDWIKENGMCLDLIRPGKSTIPGAGKGAFSQGFIVEGALISPAPLLNIKDKILMRMHDLYDEETEELEDLDGQPVVGIQLLFNYCFSHVESPLMLCPQTNMILMNHCSTRKPSKGHCKNGPNAKVQWGTSWDADTSEWLKMSYEDVVKMTSEQRRGLSLEVIATKNIYPGEEVFIDYGENWEAAYEEHVADWEPPVDDGTYIPVRTMIDNKDFRTIKELEENPYPENVMTVCYFTDGERHEDEDYLEDGEIILSEFNGSSYVAEGGMDVHYDAYECNLEDKEIDESGSTVLTVRILYSETKNYILTEFPEESITFKTRMYKGDQFLPGAFRHFIEIDDNIFPEQWKLELEYEEGANIEYDEDEEDSEELEYDENEANSEDLEQDEEIRDELEDQEII